MSEQKDTTRIEGQDQGTLMLAALDILLNSWTLLSD